MITAIVNYKEATKYVAMTDSRPMPVNFWDSRHNHVTGWILSNDGTDKKR